MEKTQFGKASFKYLYLWKIFVSHNKMNNMNTLLRLLVIVLVQIFSTQVDAQTTFNVTVTVNDLDSNDGKVFIALYASEADFLENSYQGTTSIITDKTCKVVFTDIPQGVYAVSIFHDENDNGKMDTNFMGIPKEDYGCSNDASGFMGPPKWKDAKFDLNQNLEIAINL
jgi:uncharacterized protein (DUF2141 family)